MAALVEDGIALATGTFAIYGICMLMSVASVAMVNWSALKQVCIVRITVTLSNYVSNLYLIQDQITK